MGKTVYFDCFSGASGDMVIGALLDLGLPLDDLRAALGSLAIEYGGVSSERVLRAGVSATRFRVHADEHAAGPSEADAASTASFSDSPASREERAHGHSQAHKHSQAHDHSNTHDHSHSHSHSHTHEHSHQPGDSAAETHAHPHGHSHSESHAAVGANAEPAGSGATGGVSAPAHRHTHEHHSLKEIAGFIGRSALSAAGKDRAVHLFERLAEAEAAIHAMPVERVHLHEVGALDSIIDIVGAVHGMEQLGATTVQSSALNVGSGTVQCAHGTFPVPAPATARLLQGVPIYAGAIAAELVTPTGALIVTGYASEFGRLPEMRVSGIGYGAGSRDFAGHPNVLRMLVGEGGTDPAVERIVSIECEIDDMNPQLFGPLMDRLTDAGALEVFFGAVQMKKNRPGTLVTVLAHPGRREALAGVLFAHTTTIGVRYHEMLRDRLDREIRPIDTPLGVIRFKVATRAGRILNATAEFEDCARVAADKQMAIKDVQAIAIKAWLDSGGGEPRRKWEAES